MKKVLMGLVLLLFFLPSLVSAATYYVDATGGDDSNNGTSESSAWQTLSKVNGYSFSPGDTIYFKRGETWTGGLVIDDSGEQDNPITFTAYGTGDKPVFRNPGDLTTLTKAILINADWVVVDGLLARDAFYGGVWISSGSDHNIVRNCEATNVGFGFAVFGQYNLITRNYAHDLNMIINTPEEENADDDFGAVGVQVGKSNNEVSYNIMIDCIAPSYDYGVDGGAVEFFGTVDNCYIHHNWATGCDGFFEAGGGSARNTTLAYNVGVNNNGVFFWVHTTGGYGSVIDDFYVHHNTIVESEDLEAFDWSLFGFSGSTYTDEFFLRNNIFYVNDFWFVSDADRRGWNFNHEYNLYYMPDPRTSLGFSLGNGEIISDPLFISLADFHLQQESPAIDAGIDLGYSLDFEDNPLPIDGDNNGSAEYDMGAYEYGSSTCEGTCKPNPCDTYDDCVNVSGECSLGYHCCSGIACIDCGDTHCDPGENCSSCPIDCGCVSPEICCNGVCTTPICSQNSDCGSDPCKNYTCSNPGTCSASCSSQDITSCINDDGCCPSGCNEGNDSDCGGPEGPVAWYHFDEGFGTTTADSSGNGNDGTINGATWTNNSIFGYALEFGGDDDYIDCGNDASLGVKTNFTWELWFKANQLNKNQFLIQRGFDMVRIEILSNNRVRFMLANETWGWIGSTVSSTTIGTSWYHVAGIYDADAVKLYLNGVLEDSDVGTAFGTEAGRQTYSTIIGYESFTPAKYFNGTIDEVRIYNRTLTPEEVLALYNGTNDTQPPITGDLTDDGVIDIYDLVVIGSNFGRTSGFDSRADTDNNSMIDVSDLVFVASRFT